MAHLVQVYKYNTIHIYYADCPDCISNDPDYWKTSEPTDAEKIKTLTIKLDNFEKQINEII
jgi:hypothetical protein